MAFLTDIATYLDTQLASLTVGTNLFAGVLPETPQTAVALFESTSMPPMETHGTGTRPVIERPRLQVIVRSSDYAGARSLADDVWEVLQAVSGQTFSGTRYLRIASIDSPQFLDRDSQQRPRFTTNYDTWKELS